LWVSDPAANVDLVRTLRVARAEGDAVSVFALRAVEALRGARLELEQQRRLSLPSANTGEPGSTALAPGRNDSIASAEGAGASVTEAATSASVPSKTKTHPPNASPVKSSIEPPVNPKFVRVSSNTLGETSRKWSILGGAILGSERNGLSTTGGPALDVRYRAHPRLLLGLAWDGPLTAELSVPRAGKIAVNQEILEIQARLAFVQWKRAEIDGLGSTGVSRFAVSGSPQAQFQGLSAHTFGWTLGAGFGVVFYLSNRWILGLDLQWLHRIPAPVIGIRMGTETTALTDTNDSLLLGKIGIGVMF
jgi:hypothetical protein